MNRKLLGISFAAVFAIAMIGTAYANGGWSELTSAESAYHAAKANPKGNQPERYTIEANTVEGFETCPEHDVCGIGSFITSGTALIGVDYAMATAAIHTDFCDHAWQGGAIVDCIPGSLTLPVPADGDPDVPHPHVLGFSANANCDGINPFGVELVSENDLPASILEIKGDSFELKVEKTAEVSALDSDVHTWTVAINNGSVCPVILDTASDED